MDSRTNWLLLINAALGSFLAGTASRIFAVSMPTAASSLTRPSSVSLGRDLFSDLTISLSLVFGRIGDIYGRQKIFGLGFVVSRYRCMSLWPLPECLPTDWVSIFPGDWRFHDAI